MAKLNYTNRLTNLQNRRFDKELNESLISKSFSSRELPDNIKYMLESMKAIDKKYNDRTIEAAKRVQNHLEGGYNLHFGLAYRTQGSVTTGTNIKVHSDFDLLNIINRYFYPEKSNGNDYTASDPDEDIKDMRKQAIKILKGVYDEVDDSGEKSISIYNKSLNRKVDVVFGFWYNTEKYEETKATDGEYYRGIYLYKFPNGPRNSRADYPFAHIHQVNYKGDTTSDGSRKGIRLLKTLRADCDQELKNLKSFQITSLVNNIESQNIHYKIGNELSIAQAISQEMENIISKPEYRKNIKSPNGTEYPFSNDEIIPDVKRLKEDLDELIEDSAKEILNSQVIKKAILTY